MVENCPIAQCAVGTTFGIVDKIAGGVLVLLIILGFIFREPIYRWLQDE